MRLWTFAKAGVAGTALFVGLLSGAAAQTLKIGVIAPLSGPGAPWGLAAKYAAELAADDVNAKGGLNVGGKKYQVQAIAYDDQYKAAEAVAAYTRLTRQDGAKYLMIATSAPTMAVKQNIEDDKVVVITSAFASAAIDDNTKYMFRLYSTSDNYIPAYIAWMKKNIKESRMVTVNPNDETGWAHSKNTGEHYKKNGFDFLASELYERSTKEFSPLLTKLLALKPDAMDLGTSSPATAGLIVRQARELGYKGRIVQTGGAGWFEVVETAGKDAAAGLVNVLYTDTSTPGFKTLAAAYEKKAGHRPNELIAPYYDGWRVLMAAIEKAGDVNDTTKVAASFKTVLPMTSVQGAEMSWGGRQQVLTTEYVSIVEDGKPVIKGTIK
jgi:branched-chain amino acid transport system substrate-binding protein